MSDFTKEHKYFVIKIEDAKNLLQPDHHEMLKAISRAIGEARAKQGKVPFPDYIVCNEDEPYAAEIWKAIANGEMGKI